jgi:outer membrane protein OmpA-like peptidoglycan-associated protein
VAPLAARGQARQGFQLNRYEPTAAGEWSFMVDHPWYSSTRWFAAGITLNYAHDPLVLGLVSQDGTFRESRSVIAHQLLGHIDLAGSFLDRVTISATLPVVLLERGEAAFGITPLGGGAVGDPRLGAMVRLFGQPERSAFSLNLGAWVWIPLRKFAPDLPAQSSDQEARVLPKLVAAGRHSWLRWSASLGFLYRAEAVLGDLPNPNGITVGPAVLLGGSAKYADDKRRFAVGPELLLSTALLNGNAFTREYTGLELLLGGHYHILEMIQAGLGLGFGVLREPGTPDFRLLVRLAYAPVKKAKAPAPAEPRPAPAPAGPIDSDGDGILDKDDACPKEPGPASVDLRQHGCPLPLDRDNDGVFDKDDVCPDQPMGEQPDPLRRGCPAEDRDRDQVSDKDDKCPDVHKGLHPDPERLGCPMADMDGDQVPDKQDACPDKPGAPSPDPKKNGCPGLVALRGGQLRILKPVYFATDKDVILPKSFPVLQAVAAALKAETAIKKVRIEGHTDNRGTVAHNMDLSERRARSVLRWLIQNGVAEDRLTAKGYGPHQPIETNATDAGRAANRRVVFTITDPAL